MKVLVKEWGIKPWELGKLTTKDIQNIGLAEHTEAYIQQETMSNSSTQRSATNSKEYQDFKQNAENKFRMN